MDSKQLDEACEEFLSDILKKKGVDLKVDFEVDDSIEKLRNLEIVTSLTEINTAAPLDVAIKNLENYWTNFLVGKKSDQNVAHSLLPSFSGIKDAVTINNIKNIVTLKGLRKKIFNTKEKK